MHNSKGAKLISMFLTGCLLALSIVIGSSMEVNAQRRARRVGRGAAFGAGAGAVIGGRRGAGIGAVSGATAGAIHHHHRRSHHRRRR
jgi:hypothetical protein